HPGGRVGDHAGIGDRGRPVAGGDSVTATFAGLGSVTADFAESKEK
ncbi:hypothetical protein SAMN04490239_0492, partial [Rhodococcus koreensis]